MIFQASVEKLQSYLVEVRPKKIWVDFGFVLCGYGESGETQVKFENKKWNFRSIEEEIKFRFWSWYLVRGEQRQNVVSLIGANTDFVFCGLLHNLH